MTTNEFTTAVTIASPSGEMRLLQITDLHFFCTPLNPGRDKQTLEDLPRLVELAQPDLILMTGDLWHENPDGRGEEFMRFGIAQMEALGVPWLFTWGNHDVVEDAGAAHEAFTAAKNSLYAGAHTGGHYLVQLKDTAGNSAWDLLCLNSTAAGFQQAQRDWLELFAKAGGDGRARDAFALFHVPLRQYDSLWNDGLAAGVKLEKVCYEQEDGTTLASLESIGNIRACFCGHDHANDYSTHINGIDLVYGRATGTGGYGGLKVPKGAKLITIDPAARTYEWESVLPDGTRWRETPGVRIEKRIDAPWAHAGS